MSPAKYIIVDEVGVEVPTVFSGLQFHQDYAKGKEVISAGLVLFRPNRDGTEVHADCYGESIGLGIKSRPERDSYVIDRLILNND